MEVIFLGVGEAIDEHQPNTSLLVLAGSGATKTQVLLDCGFTGAHAFFRFSPSPLDLDAVWISHFHGDHFLGLPLLLLSFWEDGRKKPLTFVGQTGVEEKVRSAIDLAYPGLHTKIQYPLEFIEVAAGKDLSLCGMKWAFAENEHSRPCLALRLDHEKKSVFYSGEGRPTEKTLILAKNCDLIVHEAYMLDTLIRGHGTLDGCLDFARKTHAKALALVHMNRDVRRDRAEEVKEKLAASKGLNAFLPEPGDRFDVRNLKLVQGAKT